MSQKTALIVGAKGQDGTFLRILLERKGYAVVGIDREVVESTNGIAHGSVNILDEKKVFDLCKKIAPDELYYLAAFHHSSADRPIDDAELLQKSREVHVGGLENVLKAIVQLHLSTRVLYASSCLIFGESEDEIQNEQTPYKPNSAYSITKVEGMELCKQYREENGVFASSVILYNHESELRPDIFLSKKIVKAALDIRDGKQTELVVGDVSSRTDWGYAPDYVDAMHKVLQLGTPDDFVVATGEFHTVQDWIDVAFAYCGLDATKYIKEDKSLIKAARKPLLGDNSKLRAATGWKPKTDFETMVKTMITELDPNRYALSICIPTFNRAGFIGKTLKSITDQFIKPEIAKRVELIVLDNISKDNTEEVVKEFVEKYTNVRYIKDRQNRNIAEGIIHAATLGTGKYVWVFSDDDVHTTHSLEKVLEAIDKNAPDILFTNMRTLIHENSVLDDNLLGVEKDVSIPTRKAFFDFLLTKFPKTIDFYTTFVSDWIIKRDIYNTHKEVFESYKEPYDVFPFQTLVLYSDFDFSSYVIADRIILFRADNASWAKKKPLRQFFYHDALWRHHYKHLVELNKKYISNEFVQQVKRKHVLRLCEFPKVFVAVMLKKMRLFDAVIRVRNRVKGK